MKNFAKLFDLEEGQLLVTIEPQGERYLLKIQTYSKSFDMMVAIGASMPDRQTAQTNLENFDEMNAQRFWGELSDPEKLLRS